MSTLSSPQLSLYHDTAIMLLSEVFPPPSSYGSSQVFFKHRNYVSLFPKRTYRPFATRVSQLKIWHFLVIGIERTVCRCTFNRYSIITQFAKLAAGDSCVVIAIMENYSNSKSLNFLLKNNKF